MNLSPFVVVGDSLAAGFSNFSLLAAQQINGPANLIARQAGIPLTLPLVPYPGLPNVLTLVSPGPPPVVGPVSGTLPSPPRVNYFEQATNLAVPGQTVGDAINKTPGPVVTGIDALTNVVLGFPTPFIIPGVPRSQLESALTLSPNFVLLWVGNNDALLAAITGDFSLLTSNSNFADSYNFLSGELAATGATMVIVNLPDITAAPYFTSLAKLSAMVGVPASVLGPLLNVQPGDYLRPGALPIVFGILLGQGAGPLPELCSSGIPAFPELVPCRLRAAEAAAFRLAIAGFNQTIAARATALKAAHVDLHALVQRLTTDGYVTRDRRLTVDFLGGLFSLDGLHPTNTGNAILANEIIGQMKRQLGINIANVNVDQISKVDPLVPR